MHERDVRVSPLHTRALEELASKLRRHFGAAIVDLRLFGSVARGESHEGSDVDVAVVFADVDWKTRREVLDLAADIGLGDRPLISPAIFSRDTWDRFRAQERPLVMDIEREGIAL